MWLITTQGFYSAVAHREDDDLIVVRARTRSDIEALEAQIPGIVPQSSESTDYRWRVVVSRAQWADAVASLARDIDYPNFKDAVDERQGATRHELYGRIWAILRRLQQDDS